MLSISKPFKGAGRADYYLNLAQEDYYLSGKEPPGFWLGEAAPLFGLLGLVKGDDFRYLLSGFGPTGESRLVHNAGSPKRRSGWDLTWSVPKSVSVAWSQAEASVRSVIEREVRAAVRRGISYLEGVGAVTRRGTDGVIHEPAKLLFAAFEHSTSRALDPQLHIHTILINVGIREDGSTGTLDPRALYRHQLAAGALFRAELAARLERSLALRARREGRCFELIGVPATIIEEFSKRRAQVLARLRELGIFTAAAAEKAAFDTRPDKEALSRDELFPRWQAVGRAHHWTEKELGFLMEFPFPKRELEREALSASSAALKALTFSDSHFSARQMVQALAEEAQGRGLDADAVLKLKAKLLISSSVIFLPVVSAEQHWTTPEMLAMEKHVLLVADAMRGKERVFPEAETSVSSVLNKHPHLSKEQRLALRHVSSAEGGLRVVSGMAGTGKTTLFSAASEVWKNQGREVFGACLSGKAACELTQATKIPSQTLQRSLNALENGFLRLNEKSVMLIDEAVMVGTRQMKTLVDYCHKANATLVLCGDRRQLQSIEAGGVFAELSDRFGAASLCDIRRQREPWARKAVRDFAEGRADEALQEFAGRGLVTLADDPERAMESLLSDWKKEVLSSPTSAIILASRTADVLILNDRVQEARLRAGSLSGSLQTIGDGNFLVGDRIVFTRNSPGLKVWNGQMATLAEISPDRVTARLDCDQTVSFSPKSYPHVQLAYALTTHKAQGMTIERAFVYVDQTAENREAAYVQASRAKGLCSFYAAAESLDEVSPAMMRSRPKVLASTLLPKSSEAPALTLELALG